MKKTHHVDENGYYGSFGGAYIPEMLFPNTEELRTQYLDIMGSESFKKEFVWRKAHPPLFCGKTLCTVQH
jgi:tryptophan synthase beta chain